MGTGSLPPLLPLNRDFLKNKRRFFILVLEMEDMDCDTVHEGTTCCKLLLIRFCLVVYFLYDVYDRQSNSYCRSLFEQFDIFFSSINPTDQPAEDVEQENRVKCPCGDNEV